MTKIIEVIYRKWGSYSSYVECGSYKVDKFGDTVWERETYPHKDERLEVKETLDGAYGKAQTWAILKIIVPDDYPLVIREKGAGKQVNGYTLDLHPPE